MSKILILTASVDGHTRTINQYIARALVQRGHQVQHQPLDDHTPPPARSGVVLIGASIRYGKHRPIVSEYINRHRALLDERLTGFFSVNLVARKPEKNTPETNPYVIKLFDALQWTPNKVAVFAGKLDYPRYRFFDRLMIRFIMWLTKGPTDTTQTTEFTNWSRVDAFIEEWATMLENEDSKH